MKPISFSDDDFTGVQILHNDALVCSANLGGVEVRRLLVDTGSSCDILYISVYEKTGLKVSDMEFCSGPIIGFTGHPVLTLGVISFPVTVSTKPKTMMKVVKITVVKMDSTYNDIIGRSFILTIEAILSPFHQIKFSTLHGVGL